MTRALRLGIAACIGLVAACSRGVEVVPGPERVQVQLSEPEVRAIAQLLRYEDRREYDAAVFDRLADGTEEVRRRVAMAAGRIGDSSAVGLLTRLLDDDPSTAVRADAAFALGELGDTSRPVIGSLREAVPAGWVPPRNDETDVVVEVVHALGKLGSFEARAMVADALRSAHPGGSENGRRVAAEALLAMWRFQEGPGRVTAVVRYLDLDDAALRWRAAYALMRLGTAEGVPRLLGALDDEDHRTRAFAARGLAAELVDSAGIRDTATFALTAALADEHPHVRINAVRALGAYGDDAPADRMAALVADENPHVARAAAEALAAMPERAAVALRLALARSDRPFAVRAAAARTLAAVEPDTVTAQLEAWAEGDFVARYAAARSLAAVGWDRAAPLVRRLVSDPDPRVAVAATSAAGGMAADTAAPEAQGRELLGLLVGVARDEQRRPAIVALRGLEPLLEPDDLALLRSDVGLEGADDAEPEARSTAFYEDVVRTYVAPALAGRDRPRARIRTLRGEIDVELLSEEAPLTVHNFVRLASDGFWDDGVWHRVVPNFVLQDGAPAGDPGGGPGWSIRDEINRVRYTRGTMGMALSGPDTGGSQWFITHSPQHHLDGGYTVFGRVVGGMDVADAVLQGDPILSIRIP